MSKVLTVSVIVPTHQWSVELERCVASLFRATPPAGEIVIVADGVLLDDYPIEQADMFHILSLEEAAGPAKARNLGAQRARGDILFFVDSDVEIPADAIGRIIVAFSEDPTLAALIGSYDDAPGAQNFLSQYKNLLHHFMHQMGADNASTFWGACGAIRKEVFMAVGGFDTSYRQPSVEDIELGYRLTGAGCPISLRKDLQVKHLKRWSAASLLRSDIVGRALPWTKLIWRDRRLINDLNLGYSSRLSTVLALALLLALGMSIFLSGAVFAAALIASSLLLLNWRLYWFFRSKRGLWFALKTVPWHWFYFLYSGVAFIIGTLVYLIKANGRRKVGKQLHFEDAGR